MLPQTPNSLGRVQALVEGLLQWLMVAAAFLLGCQQLFDADVWWHVRAGQWILVNGKVPEETAAYHRELKIKFQLAARCPWLFLDPDPPQPYPPAGAVFRGFWP
jgi:hypothetical protein